MKKKGFCRALEGYKYDATSAALWTLPRRSKLNPCQIISHDGLSAEPVLQLEVTAVWRYL